MSDFLIPQWPAPSNVAALSTTRRGGTSSAPYDDGEGGGGFNLGAHVGDDPQCVQANRRLLCGHLPAEPAWLNQVHGTRVVDAGLIARAGEVPDADASVAVERGAVCIVQTADCLPVLLCDRAGAVVGAAHAGWRGLLNGILENTVAEMRLRGAQDLLAWLGPAIGPESFEVGEEVRAAFVLREAATADAFRPLPSRGKFLADLYQLARARLAQVGVEHVYGGGFCTMRESERFYSFRRESVTGRMASMIWLRPA